MIFHRSGWTALGPATSLFLMIRHLARLGVVRRRLAAAAVSGLFLSVAPSIHAASVPVLMVLQYTEAGKTIQTKVETKAGLVASPDKGKPEEKWIIGPGDAIRSDSAPDERTVNFFKAAGNESILLFIIKVRYFRNGDGLWVPQFQLDEEPLVVRENGRWRPLTIVQGVPNLIEQTGTALPNADGYSTSLEVGFTTGATSIDGWLVQ
jgi:hypothetical protein